MGLLGDILGIGGSDSKRSQNQPAATGPQQGQDDPTGNYGEDYGTRILRRVKRATKRIGADKGNGRE